jgi:hypothetical protein
MISSRIFPAINAVVAIATAALEATETTVIDGPVSSQVPDGNFLCVGADTPYNSGTQIMAVDGDSDWAALGARAREETFTIWCTYVAWTGDSDLSDARARAATDIGELEAALRAAPGFNLNGTLPSGWVALVITRVSQVNTDNGVQVHVLFGVVCRARI